AANHPKKRSRQSEISLSEVAADPLPPKSLLGLVIETSHNQKEARDVIDLSQSPVEEEAVQEPLEVASSSQTHDPVSQTESSDERSTNESPREETQVSQRKRELEESTETRAANSGYERQVMTDKVAMGSGGKRAKTSEYELVEDL